MPVIAWAQSPAENTSFSSLLLQLNSQNIQMYAWKSRIHILKQLAKILINSRLCNQKVQNRLDQILIWYIIWFALLFWQTTFIVKAYYFTVKALPQGRCFTFKGPTGQKQFAHF